MDTAAMVELRHRLERDHVGQLKQFQLHQEILVMREGRRALEVLEKLETRLVSHMELEERYLLPLCESYIDRPGYWGPHVYMQEHRRIKELIAAVRLKLEALCAHLDGALSPTDVIGLLDEEKVLKSLISHHQTREETALYPGIFDKVVASAGEAGIHG